MIFESLESFRCLSFHPKSPLLAGRCSLIPGFLSNRCKKSSIFEFFVAEFILISLTVFGLKLKNCVLDSPVTNKVFSGDFLFIGKDALLFRKVTGLVLSIGIDDNFAIFSWLLALNKCKYFFEFESSSIDSFGLSISELCLK